MFFHADNLGIYDVEVAEWYREGIAEAVLMFGKDKYGKNREVFMDFIHTLEDY